MRHVLHSDWEWLDHVWHGGRRLWQALKDLPDGIWFSFLFFIDLHSLFPCQVLLHLRHILEDWDCLFLPFSEKTLFLRIPYLWFLLRCPILPQLRHLAFWCLFIPLEIASSTQALVLQSNVSAFFLCRIHSCIGGDMTFKGPSVFSCSKLAF